MTETTGDEVFIYKLKPGAADAYDRHHAAVWPEVIANLRAHGVSRYRIFRREDLVISIVGGRSKESPMDVPAALLAKSEQWAELMAPLFEETLDGAGNELFAQLIFDIDDYPVEG